MKGKLYAFGAVGIIALFAIGLKVKTEFNKPVYQSKDYTDFKYQFGLAEYSQEFYRLLREDENGNIDPKDVAAARRNMLNHSKSKAPANWMYWNYMGPNFVGGRTRALIIDNQPNNKSTLYAGMITGGVYFSHNGASTWGTRSGDLACLNVSDIAQTPNGTLFIATGSSHNESVRGCGLFRRAEDANGNSVYTKILGPTTSSTSGLGTMNRVIGHPTENKLYVGTGNGLRVTTDAMAAASEDDFFNPIVVGGFPLPGDVDDIAMSSDGSVIYVTFSGSSTIYKLKDNGGNDVTLEKSFDVPSGIGSISRMALTVSPQDPNILYASATNSASSLYGVFQTKDGGDTWNVIGQKGTNFDPLCQIDGTSCQGNYDMAIGVNPNNSGQVLLGGVSMWMWNESKTTPGTGGWIKVATTQGSNNNLLDSNYLHADKHRIVYADSLTVYVAHDGGVAKSLDGGRTWSQNNNGYATTQFYTIANAMGDPDEFNQVRELVMGGTQDNGTQMVGFRRNRPMDGFEISGGDGFACKFSNLSGLAFTSIYRGSILRIGLGGGGGTFYDTELEDLGCGAGGCGQFRTHFDYWETAYRDETKDSLLIFNRDSTKNIKKGDIVFYNGHLNVPMEFPASRDLNFGDSAYFPDFSQSAFVFATGDGLANGTGSVYMTRDASNLNKASAEWDLIADRSNNTYPDPIAGSVYKFAFSTDGNQLFLSTYGGDIYRIDNLNEGYDSLTLDIRSPQCVLTCTRIFNGNGLITSMSIDPNNANNIVFTYGGFGSGQKIRRISNASTAGHDGANSISIMGDFPDNIPVYASMIAAHDPNTVIVGTEFGIYATNQGNVGNAEWHYGWGVPRGWVYDLSQQDRQYLFNDPPPSFTVPVPKIENTLYKVAYAASHGFGFWKTDALVGIEDNGGEGGKTVTSIDPIYFNVYPNPMNTNGYIDLDIPENQQVKIDIFDLNGKLINTIQNGVMSKGKTRLEFNAMNMRNGSYIATLRAGDEVKVSKFVVIR